MTIAIVSEGGSGKTCTAGFRVDAFEPVTLVIVKDKIVKQLTNHSFAHYGTFGLLAAIGMLLNLGCSAMTPPPPPASPSSPASNASYKVIFGTNEGKVPEIYDGQLDGNLTVQDALVASGAISKYGKGMTVDLARRLETGRVLKMPVNYDNKTASVMEEQNYAIHAGDEILVRRVDSGMMKAVFENMKAPF